MARWCEAGKNHIWLRQDNQAQLCCSCSNQDEHKFLINNFGNNFLDVINSKHVKEKYKTLEYGPLKDNSCNICLDTESKFKKSIRQKIKNSTKDGEKFFFKIDFSNKCNLKCVMCSSGRSTNWIKDEQKLKSFYEQYNYSEPEIYKYQSLGNEWFANIDINWWENLETLEISGGEPFYQEEVLDFLEFISQYNTELKLTIITNATMLNDEILNIIKRYKRLAILCSVDAWQDDVYNYSRYGTGDLSTVKENIKILYSYSKFLSIVDTVHPFNYDQKQYALEWIENQNFKENFSYVQSLVYSPLHLNNDTVLPLQFWNSGGKDLDLQVKFARWTLALDKIRKTNVFDIRPEFESWFRNMNVC